MSHGRSLSALVVGVLVLGACVSPSASDLATSAGPSTPSANASPSAEPSATPATTATPAPAAVHWEQIATVDAPDPFGDWRLIAGFDHGYVALQRNPPAAWFSPDGTTWTRTALGAPDGFAGTAHTIASNGASILVGGDYIPCTRRQYADDPFHDCRPRPVSWVSSDGLKWQTSGPWTGPNGEQGRSGSLFETVWPVPTGGWDAGQMFDLSDESNGFPLAGPAIWHSPDGLTWTPYTDAPGEDPTCGTFGVTDTFDAAADATGRRLAVTSAPGECPFPVFTSSDGRDYASVESFPAQGQTYMSVVLPPVDGRPWRLFGGLEGTGQGFAWSSADLATWSATPMNPDGAASAGVLAAIHEAGRDVAVGRSGERGATWISEDGVAWRLAAGAGPEIETLASGPAGTLGLVGTWMLIDEDTGSQVTGFEVWKLVEDR